MTEDLPYHLIIGFINQLGMMVDDLKTLQRAGYPVDPVIRECKKLQKELPKWKAQFKDPYPNYGRN